MQRARHVPLLDLSLVDLSCSNYPRFVSNLIPSDTLPAILCGGRSRRFGSDKAAAVFGSDTLLDRAVDTARRAFGDPVLVGSAQSGGSCGLTTIPDIFPGAGPAGAIHAALVHARDRAAHGIWSLPCDAPFADYRLGLALAERADAGIRAVVPRSEGPLGIEPAFAWYSVGALDTFERCIRRGELALHRIIPELDPVSYLTQTVLQELGIPGDVFFNINTRADLEAALRRVGTVED